MVLWVSLEVGVSFISIVMGHPVICCQSPPSSKLLVFSVDTIRDNWFLNSFPSVVL